MKKKIIAAAVLMTLHLGVASYSAAAERGFYFGAGAGKSTLDADINLDVFVSDVLVPLSSSDLDKTGSAFEGLVGYRFLPYLAVEAAYMDLGELNYTASGVPLGLGFTPISLGVDVGTRGVAGSVLGILPLSERWELFGRAGLLFADNEVTIRVSGDDFSQSQSDSQSSQNALLGIGAAFNARDRWTLRLEYRYLRDVDEDEDDDSHIDLVSLGFVYRL